MQRITSIMRFRAQNDTNEPDGAEAPDSDSESESGEDAGLPVVPLLLQPATEVSDSDIDSVEDEPVDSHCPALDANQRGDGNVGVDNCLPSADGFDHLGDDTFLRVAPSVTLDPTWKMTPDEQAVAAATARKQRGAASAGSLPMNKYGRGLNLLQLDVELSARAGGSSREGATGARSAEEPEAWGEPASSRMPRHKRPGQSNHARGGPGTKRQRREGTERKWTEAYEA